MSLLLFAFGMFGAVSLENCASTYIQKLAKSVSVPTAACTCIAAYLQNHL
jgi:hypothetical protein